MLAKRIAVRPRHLEGMAKLGEHIVCVGELLDDEGKIKGSVLILDLVGKGCLFFQEFIQSLAPGA